MSFVNIIALSNAKALDRLFTYSVPASLEKKVPIGSVVEIPFGKNNRSRYGFVVETDVMPDKSIEIKEILSVIGEYSLTKEQIALVQWMKEYYVATSASILRLMLPTTIFTQSKKQIVYSLSAGEEELQKYRQKIEKTQFRKRRELLESFIETPVQEYGMLSEAEYYSRQVLQTLISDGIVEKKEIPYCVLAPYRSGLIDYPKNVLNSAQKEIADNILQSPAKTHLIHGVTGSGKTEIYFHLIEEVLKQGKQVIMLFPEIALTSALIRKFIARFGDVIGLYHSRLSEGERSSEWERANSGEVRIMMGPRSALFAPLKNPGMIILDEEHESSYKSETMPKYHAVTVAAKLGKLYQIPVVLGSATPSIENYYYALENRIQLHCLSQKAVSTTPISVEIIDMRKELEEDNRSFLSRALRKEMDEVLQRKEQVLLLNNRRGFAKFVSCRKCGFVFECPYCDIPLTYHKQPESMQCHHCGYQKKMQYQCPNCGSSYMKAFGIGTQKIEAELRKLYPDTKIVRMDADTTRSKHGHDLKLQEFETAGSGILVGTQMIAKGLDFHNVTLVGVLAVDQGLYYNDFRASERTFQLLVQVMGRTGRGQKPGKAILQSYTPEHFVIQTGKEQNYPAFYREEMAYRKMLQYPPFMELLEIILAHSSFQETEKTAKLLRKEMEELIEKYSFSSEIIGPFSPLLPKQAGKYRKGMILKSNRHKELTFLMKYLYNKQIEKSGFTLYLDINPLHMK